MNQLLIDAPFYREGTSTWDSVHKQKGLLYTRLMQGKKERVHKLNATGAAGRHPFNVITEEIYD